MLALVQLIFPGPPVNTHFQRIAFHLTAIPSHFIAVFFLFSITFFLLDSLVSLCVEDNIFQTSAQVLFHQQCVFVAAGLAVATNLYCAHPHPACMPLLPADISLHLAVSGRWSSARALMIALRFSSSCFQCQFTYMKLTLQLFAIVTP